MDPMCANLHHFGKYLLKINPEKLWNNQKGYYYFLLATADMQNQSMANSEKNLRTALNYGLRMDHDKAAAYLNLSVLAANKRKKREAMMHLNEAKKFDTKGYLKKDIKEVQSALENLKKGTGTATFILGLTGSGKSSFVSYMLGAKISFAR